MSDDNKEGAGVPAIECDICQGNSALCDPHDCGDAHHPAVMPAAPSDAATNLSNLLARIHRDGGHYEGEHGTAKAFYDADCKVIEWLARDDAALSHTMQAEPAAGEQAGAVACQWDYDAAVEALMRIPPKSSIFHEFLEQIASDPTSGPVYRLTAQGRGALDELQTAYFAKLSMTDEMRSFIEGMSVSVDVSTGEDDAGHRYFGTIAEVMDDNTDRHGVTLLVQDAKPNFTATLAAPGAAIAAREQDIFSPDSCGVCHGDSARCDIHDCGNAHGAASREEAPAAPQGEALTVETLAQELRRIGSAGAEVLADALMPFLSRAALTQPTTVQQAETASTKESMLLRRTLYFVCTYADKNPKREYGGVVQDPSGVHALLAEIRAHLKGMQPGERKEGAE